MFGLMPTGTWSILTPAFTLTQMCLALLESVVADMILTSMGQSALGTLTTNLPSLEPTMTFVAPMGSMANQIQQIPLQSLATGFRQGLF